MNAGSAFSFSLEERIGRVIVVRLEAAAVEKRKTPRQISKARRDFQKCERHLGQHGACLVLNAQISIVKDGSRRDETRRTREEVTPGQRVAHSPISKSKKPAISSPIALRVSNTSEANPSRSDAARRFI